MRPAQEIQGKLFVIIFFQAVIFLFAIFFALIFYPGGSRFDTTTPYFNVFEAFFSDLGRITALNGESNIVSRVFFVIGLINFSLAFVELFALLFWVYHTRKIMKWFSLFAMLLAMFLAAATIALAFTPVDFNSQRHNRLIYFAASLSAVVYIIYLGISLKDRKNLPRMIPNLFILLVGYDVLFALTMVIGVWLGDHMKFLIRALGHTASIFLQGVCVTLLAYFYHLKAKTTEEAATMFQKQPS